MDLQALSNLGLPGWLVGAAAIVFILKQVGLLEFLTSRFVDVQEHRQASENVAIEILRSVIRESITEYSNEMRDFDKRLIELDKSIYKLGRQIENNTQAVRALAGAIEKNK